MFLAMTPNSASVRGSCLNAAQPALGYVAGLAAASEPYNTRSAPIWRMRVAICFSSPGNMPDPTTAGVITSVQLFWDFFDKPFNADNAALRVLPVRG